MKETLHFGKEVRELALTRKACQEILTKKAPYWLVLSKNLYKKALIAQKPNSNRDIFESSYKKVAAKLPRLFACNFADGCTWHGNFCGLCSSNGKHIA
jgi:hypothetical protein